MKTDDQIKTLVLESGGSSTRQYFEEYTGPTSSTLVGEGGAEFTIVSTRQCVPSARQSKTGELGTSSTHTGIPDASLLLRCEELMCKAEALTSGRSLSTIRMMNSIESSIAPLRDNFEAQRTVKRLLEQLETKVEALREVSRRHTLVSLPHEEVRAAADTVEGFVACTGLLESVALMLKQVRTLEADFDAVSKREAISGDVGLSYLQAVAHSRKLDSLEAMMTDAEGKFDSFRAQMQEMLAQFEENVQQR